MGNKVSDFKIAEFIIKKMCSENSVPFSDINLSFDSDKNDGSLFIGKTKNVSHTIFRIISEYVNKSKEITGKTFLPDGIARDDFFILLASNLRSLVFDKDNRVDFNETYASRLYQYPVVWLLLKDIICPVFNKQLVNFKVICSNSYEIDIAKYINEEETKNFSEEPFIFVNNINNDVVQNAFMFIESIKAHGLSEIKVIKDIYESDLYEKYKGLLDISLDNEDDVSDFESTVMAILGVSCYGIMSKKMSKFYSKTTKVASKMNKISTSQFWYLGVLEKMIEPTRGSDWSVYRSLEPYAQKMWNEIEEVKIKRLKTGKDAGVPFDMMLRLKEKQTADIIIDPTKTIQALLSSNRIW